MKILYIHQYFNTPLEAGGTRSYWMAQKLLEKGHTVTVITSSSQINKKIDIKNINGINVIYLRVPYSQKMNFIRRLQSFFNFMIKSTFYAFKLKNIDLIIATSTPLTVGFPALALNKLKKIPFVFEVRDLWPEVPIQMGGLKSKFLQKLAILFEKKIYKNSEHIIALSPGMKKGILKYELNEKVSVIPNMSKNSEFWPRKKNIQLTEELGLKENSFKVIHFGALGIANGVQTIIESAKLLKENNNIEFVFIGGGATEDKIIKLCKHYRLENVHFLGRFPMMKTSEIVNLCDISVVSFLDLPILYTNSPNKLFDSLSAGKPIIVNSAGWTKELIEKHNCGFYVNPNNPLELVNKINYLIEDKEKFNEMSFNSRKLAKKYDKSILSEKFANIIEQITVNLKN
jgi:glycosyltransferase involved in cell wall biosynthesis